MSLRSVQYVMHRNMCVDSEYVLRNLRTPSNRGLSSQMTFELHKIGYPDCPKVPRNCLVHHGIFSVWSPMLHTEALFGARKPWRSVQYWIHPNLNLTAQMSKHASVSEVETLCRPDPTSELGKSCDPEYRNLYPDNYLRRKRGSVVKFMFFRMPKWRNTFIFQ